MPPAPRRTEYRSEAARSSFTVPVPAWRGMLAQHRLITIASAGLMLLVLLTLPINWRISLAVFCVGVVVLGMILWRVRPRREGRGELCPAFVLPGESRLLAVLVEQPDREDGNRWAIRIAPDAVKEGGPDWEPGSRIPAVLLTETSLGDTEAPPEIIAASHLTTDPNELDAALAEIGEAEWEVLDAGLAQVPRPFEVGEYPLVTSELMLDTERSGSGAPVWRHEQPVRSFSPAFGDRDSIGRLTDHIEAHLGPIDNVFHEMVSDLVHVDVHVIEPEGERDYITLVTTGMSDRAMNTPPELEHLAHSELLVCLPADWKLDMEALRKEENYWPIRWLKILARFPHEYDTWLFEGHTIPNGDPPEPFAKNTELCCCLLTFPMVGDDEFANLELEDGNSVTFLQLMPLYLSEMNFKLAEGFDALTDRLGKQNIPWVVDPDRPNACEQKV